MSSLYQVRQALPSSFDFYQQGEVSVDHRVSTGVLAELIKRAPHSHASYCRVAEVQGDFQATVVTLYELGLDPSVFNEMGNLFASFLANNLSDQDKGLFRGEYLVSPPQTLTSQQILKLLTSSSERLFRRYLYQNQQSSNQVDLIVFPHSLQETHDV